MEMDGGKSEEVCKSKNRIRFRRKPVLEGWED